MSNDSSWPSDGRPSHVWYLAYGSNLSAARFSKYLQGAEIEPGARNPEPPTDDRWFDLLFRLDFGLESRRWNGGGVAFVFPDQRHRIWFRGWRITGEQFEDVYAQENRLAVGTPLPWNEIDASPATHLDLDGGWYRRLYMLREIEAIFGLDAPAFTFTATEPVERNRPHADYLQMLGDGLAQNPHIDGGDIDAYLDRVVAGVADNRWLIEPTP